MKRTLLLGTAWTASAASAVGLGFLAVSLVDASATRGTIPLAAASTATSSDDAAAPSSTSTATVQTHYTAAGTVTADCTAGEPHLAKAAAAGWWVDDSDDPKAGEVEFENATQKLEVHVTCVDGIPRFAVEGPRADDNRGKDDQPSTAPASTDAPDDSDGRVGGGHGSDDPPGDDSRSDNSGKGSNNSGKGSDDSGKGSDDSGSDDSGKGSDDSGKGSDDSGSDDSGSSGGDDSGGDDSGGHGSDD
jgi:hypothetical protein